ncbi:hypothetical protein BDN67DRAFT_510334 [Paxillus ammoniavirescens]|nr:hypothetical protein BDN67DRAFT_510334 [Paxillus ammoniavirescens]
MKKFKKAVGLLAQLQAPLTNSASLAAVSLVKKVARASQQLITLETGYSKCVKYAPNSHIQLEGQLQRIVAASNLALGIINKSPSPCNDPDIAHRLVEWLLSDEPQNCLNTLKAMEKLLKDRPVSRQFLIMILSVRNERTIQEAIALFNKRRPSFHLLLQDLNYACLSAANTYIA